MSFRIQTALVVLLFLGSLSALVANIYSVQVSPQQEREVRRQLREAGHAMAEGAITLASPGPLAGDGFDRLNRKLAKIASQTLAGFPGVEGGFYLNRGAERFAGHSFPTRDIGRKHPHGKKKQQTARSDPPPLEAPYIRLQARDSLRCGPGEFMLSIHDIQSSRVMILTEPVGTPRPTAMAVWAMYRLIDPSQMGNQVRRYQASTGFAIAGLALAILLTVNLGRSLYRQRREQQQLREELRRSEHLAALGKLLAGVAHEVRNPLAAIRSTVQLWQRLPEESRTPASLDSMVQAVDSLNRTVTQLLQFSRADYSRREPVEINSIWRETLELLKAAAAEKGVLCNADLERTLPKVEGSAAALRQAFLNLATNALQAMPDGGQLCVKTTYNAHSNEVEAIINDTGPGVSQEDQRRLFEPFFTTRPEGTGLGLPICREILVQHGGKIDYLPSAGGGATFRLRLPVLQRS